MPWRIASHGKFIAQKEVAMAQTAMLGGKMGECAVHLTRGNARGHDEVKSGGRGRLRRAIGPSGGSKATRVFHGACES
jgi:hypothetical protein